MEPLNDNTPPLAEQIEKAARESGDMTHRATIQMLFSGLVLFSVLFIGVSYTTPANHDLHTALGSIVGGFAGALWAKVK